MTDAAMRLNAIDNIREHWGWFLALGIIFIIGGVLAIFAPGLASLTVTIVVAIVLAWIGIMQIIQAFSVTGWGGFVWQLIIGLILLAGGIVVYFNPVAGTLVLTIAVAAAFVAKGIMQIIMSFQLRPNSAWIWMLIAGILAILVGAIIAIDWPVSSVWALGYLAGISLIFSGWSYVMMSLAAKRIA
jgi:uncharacterized membrane protein HdeD (DUF308 family)